jgi:hypothetical protein
MFLGYLKKNINEIMICFDDKYPMFFPLFILWFLDAVRRQMCLFSVG